MPKAHKPRLGSMQYWPRKRARHSLARIRSWAANNKAKPLGFIGYKAGMTYVVATDNRAKSLTKGEKISLPVTIVDCPEMTVVGICFYKKSLLGVRKLTSIFMTKPSKELARKISLPKKEAKKIEDITNFVDLRLLVQSNPRKTPIGNKKPKLLEIALGGSKEDKLAYAKEIMGKSISIEQIFESGELVDVHGITKGKGFQGTVKRFGVPIKQHKGEKVKRGIGNLGAWTPKRVQFTVPQPGKMGYHLRTEYNKQVIKVGDNGSEVTPKSGLTKYGIVKNNYLLLHGSLPGSRKRALVVTMAIRPNKKISKDAFQINSIFT